MSAWTELRDKTPDGIKGFVIGVVVATVAIIVIKILL